MAYRQQIRFRQDSKHLGPDGVKWHQFHECFRIFFRMATWALPISPHPSLFVSSSYRCCRHRYRRHCHWKRCSRAGPYWRQLQKTTWQLVDLIKDSKLGAHWLYVLKTRSIGGSSWCINRPCILYLPFCQFSTVVWIFCLGMGWDCETRKDEELKFQSVSLDFIMCKYFRAYTC